MTLQQLKYVIEVSKRGSISEAAKKLFISQPSLSNAIKELEIELDISIFDRTNRGIVLSKDGIEFMGYARQVVEQSELLESRYLNFKSTKRHFSVSTQHYAFAVNAYVNLIKRFDFNEYEFSLKETKTYDIIQNVKNMDSEIGILYINQFNENVINKLLKESRLKFNSLFVAKPHIFVSSKNPLAGKPVVSFEELDDYPCLSFEQGEYNSFHFSEEIFSTLSHKKSIKVSDRATLFNLLIGLNGYTISTGVLSRDLNGNEIVPVPLEEEESINVGWICHKAISLTDLGTAYVEELKAVVEQEYK